MTQESTHQVEPRRLAPRLPFSGLVHVCDNLDVPLRARNLSTGGVALVHHSPFGTGSQVEIAFLHGGMRVQGIVCHEAPSPESGYHIGVAFVEPQPELVAVVLSVAGDIQ